MHLWPSLTIRESFKKAYLDRMEWNLHRMKLEKNQPQSPSSNQQKLLDNDGSGTSNDAKLKKHGGRAILLCRELLMIFSCCYCCFCCGACVEEEN